MGICVSLFVLLLLWFQCCEPRWGKGGLSKICAHSSEARTQLEAVALCHCERAVDLLMCTDSLNDLVDSAAESAATKGSKVLHPSARGEHKSPLCISTLHLCAVC